MRQSTLRTLKGVRQQYLTLYVTLSVEDRAHTCCATTGVPEVRPTGTVSALHATGILLAQLVFFHPLGRGFGEGVTKAHTLGHFEAGQTRRTPRLQLLRRGLGARP